MPISDPPTTPHWVDMTDDVQQLIRQRLQNKFDLDLSVLHISHVVDDMVKEQFKEYHDNLHKRYKQCVNHEEVVQSTPPHVTHDDWQILCDRFSSDSFQRDSVTGQEPGPVDLYRGTHCRQATGSWVHPRASEISTVREKCFAKCITKPGTSLSGSESSCISRCVERCMEATGEDEISFWEEDWFGLGPLKCLI
ncbi:uncharacterized protein LOC131254274 [Magnolia sinica]|uniref:uncharacterized protein LOC131254274 n=1 Tax=Magnolia sinica TaxID=86752 RepID=UPI00265B0C86|nr:uncharacterized protein LOC131254274 [Magnolia sinica]